MEKTKPVKSVNPDKKKPISFRFSKEMKELLELVAKHHKRSSTNMLEYLIDTEAARQKIKLPK